MSVNGRPLIYLDHISPKVRFRIKLTLPLVLHLHHAHFLKALSYFGRCTSDDCLHVDSVVHDLSGEIRYQGLYIYRVLSSGEVHRFVALVHF
jgi:hypothetical protein